MAHALYTNNAVATLASGISAGDTSATLTAGQGALFPNPLTGNYFWGTLNDAATGLVIEIVQVTARSTDTLTIVRAQQGTSANAYLAGDKFELRVTAQGLQDLQPISELGAAAYDNIVTIANGGSNSSSYTAPAGGISPLVYYDGTKFSTDAVVADAGYNTSTNTINSTNFVASANLSGTSLKLGFQSIATNGGTTTFTVTSPYYTIFTGTQAQTVILPDATTLSVGWKYGVDNDSTQSITINANGGGAFWIVAPGCDLYITLSSNASAAGTWEKDYNAAKVANGKGVTISNSMTFTGPDGGTNSFNSLTDAGNLTFTGTGNRITGDFTNGTLASSVLFQTSTTNGLTSVRVIPNGTSPQSNFSAYGSTGGTFDPANNSVFIFASGANAGTEARITSGIVGTGTYLPMTFYTGGSERLRIDTSGNVGVGIAATTKFDVNGVTRSLGYSLSGTGVNGGTAAFAAGTISSDTNWGMYFRTPTGSSATANFSFRNSSDTELMRIDSSGNVGIGTAASSFGGANLQVTNATVASVLVSDTTHIGEMLTTSGGVSLGTRSNHTLTLVSNDTARATLDTTGNFLLTSTGGLGYGTGSGGSVTQGAGSGKATAVTLDKTNGQITMNGAALAGNTRVVFNFSNSKIAISDTVIVNTQQFGLNYTAIAHGVGTGGCYISVTNVSGGSLSEAVVLNFAVIKAAIT